MGKCHCCKTKKIDGNLLVEGNVAICGDLLVKDSNLSLNVSNTTGQVTIDQDYLDANATQHSIKQYTWIFGINTRVQIPIDLTGEEFKPSLGYIYNEIGGALTVKVPVPVTATPVGGPFVQGSAIFEIPSGQVATINISRFQQGLNGIEIFQTKLHLSPISSPFNITRP